MWSVVFIDEGFFTFEDIAFRNNREYLGQRGLYLRSVFSVSEEGYSHVASVFHQSTNSPWEFVCFVEKRDNEIPERFRVILPARPLWIVRPWVRNRTYGDFLQVLEGAGEIRRREGDQADWKSYDVQAGPGERSDEAADQVRHGPDKEDDGGGGRGVPEKIRTQRRIVQLVILFKESYAD